MNKIDLTDITFTIPIRIDTTERVRNIKTSIEYLSENFNTTIIVGEESKKSEVPEKLGSDLMSRISYFHIQTDSSLFHRTKMLNIMTKIAKTNLIANYDADIILPLNQYVDAYNAIKYNGFDMVFPYNGRFVDIYGETLNKFLENKSLAGILESNGNLIHPNSVGGAIFWNKNSHIKIGMENENFKSWGWEDNARVATATKLGLKVARINGCLFHMNHPTSTNSANTQHEQYFLNEKEYHKIVKMSSSELSHYISNFPWVYENYEV